MTGDVEEVLIASRLGPLLPEMRIALNLTAYKFVTFCLHWLQFKVGRDTNASLILLTSLS